jgi:methionyl-tRNA formyltransferase
MASCGVPPVGIITLPPSRAARHSDYVDVRADGEALGAEILEAAGDDVTVREKMRQWSPEYLFVIGWSRIVPEAVFDLALRGAVGYHPAALPVNRGRAVIPWTILQRRTSTAGTLFWLDGGIDTGDLLAQEHFAVDPFETATTLYVKHMRALHKMLAEVLPLLAHGDRPRTPQQHELATYCGQRRDEDGYIDWRADAEDIGTLIRASTRPYPGAFTFSDGAKLRVWSADPLPRDRYTGIPGQVIDVSAEGAVVTCSIGTALLVTEVQLDGAPVSPMSLLRRQQRLGIQSLQHHAIAPEAK